MNEMAVTIPCGEITLEGVAHLPSAPHDQGAVVVCHPHPLYGGDMENPVVVTLCQALAAAGLAALRFNFRGTGRSGGRHQQGIGEQEDVLAALAAAQRLPEVDGQRLGLAGYSFGAMVAAAAAPRAEKVRALALISPPMQGLREDTLAGLAAPKLILSGEADALAPPPELQRWAARLGESCELLLLPGVDHFWSRGLPTAAARVAAFFRKHLGQAGAAGPGHPRP